MLNNKERKVAKLTMGILALITIILLVEMFVEVYVLKLDPASYFVQHFTAGICMILVGFIAFILQVVGKTKYSGDKSDDLMKLVSVLLILCGFIAIIWSYIN